MSTEKYFLYSLNFKDFQGTLRHLAFESSASLGRRFKDDEKLFLQTQSVCFLGLIDPFLSFNMPILMKNSKQFFKKRR